MSDALRTTVTIEDDGRLTVDGVALPHLMVRRQPDDGGDQKVWLTLDNRYGHEMREADLIDFAWFLGNCMAVSAGFSSIGENSRPINPFRAYPFVHGGASP